MGERPVRVSEPYPKVSVDTFAGRIQIEWDHTAAFTPMGQLLFFIEFLKASGLYEAFLADCPQLHKPQCTECPGSAGNAGIVNSCRA